MNYNFFMEKALVVAKEYLDKEMFPVGCVLVYQNKVIVNNSLKGENPSSYTSLHHSEIIALHRLYRLKRKIDRSKVILFSTLDPCIMCYSTLLVAGVKEVVYAYEDVMGGGTNLDHKHLKPLYRDTEIKIVSKIYRDKSLKLFKDFFSDPEEDYLRGTMLAEYTLKQ